MIDPALSASLAAFDDAALATLANPGLVRRAHRDVAEGKVRLMSAAPGQAEVEADGHCVVIDTKGPKAAPCACKSAAICRHRLAAVIFLRDGAVGTDDPGPPDGGNVAAGEGAGDAQAVPAMAAPAPAPALDPASILAPMTPEPLMKWAGKAAWRAALEIAPAATAVEPSAQSIAVTFPELDGPVLILRGQGLDGIVSKASKARLKAYHAAAVLAARAHFGEGIPSAPPEGEAEGPLDRGPALLDPAFLARVAAALEEAAMLGMNLAPLPVEEALFALSVSSRADALPRLAAILRGIAAQMRLRRARALEFDPDRMLELAATAFALVRALERGEPERRAGLAGKARRAFIEAEPLDLVGCGAERWTTPTGARGVTAWFMDRHTAAWYSTTLARGPGQDPGFHPREAWQAQPYWNSEPLAVLSHAAFTLAQAGLSADRRLSAPAAATATIRERKFRPDAASPGVVHDWSALHAGWMAQVGLGIDAVEEAAAALIAPSAIAPAFFDDLAQQLIWPVRDVAGRWLALTLDHEEPVSAAIEALEANVRTGWQGMVLVRLAREGERLMARPVTLLGAGDPVDLTLWQRPWRETAPVRDWFARLRTGAARPFAVQPRSATDKALAQAWRLCIDLAEVGPSLARSLDAQRGAHAERLERFGLARLAAQLRAADDSAGLLAAAYGLMLARQGRCAPTMLI